MPSQRRKSKRSKQSLASKAYKLAKKANRTELKYRDSSWIGTPISIPATGAFVSNFPYISTGALIDQRVGNTVHGTSLNAKLTIVKHASATASALRMIVFKYVSEGFPAAVTDYLQSANINSAKSTDHRFDSKTLYDKTFVLDNDNPKRHLDLRKKLGFDIHYDASSSAPDKNALVILLISDEATNQPTVEGLWRMYFTDK